MEPADPTERRQADDDALVRLMTGYQAGQLAAFEDLYAALAEDLRRFFAAAVPGGDAAADLVQDTFLEIHRSRHTYLPPLPVRPWVFGVARNVLGRHRRSVWRRGRHESRALEPDDERIGASVEPGSSGVEPGDVAAALRRLPAGRRAVWVMHHIHGWSFRQIAERFRIGVGAAKLRSSRATKALRVSLGSDGGTAPDGGDV